MQKIRKKLKKYSIFKILNISPQSFLFKLIYLMSYSIERTALRRRS